MTRIPSAPWHFMIAAICFCSVAVFAQAHEGHAHDQQQPEIAKAFRPFVETDAIKTRWDDRYFYVESSGFPSHPMMIGITNWQQQIPLPQPYTGSNAWQIPLNPVPAQTPLMTKDRFLRGAIALAVNGVPIFNPLNNRGEDSFLIGELDEFGGHCGRADDYHYHIAPVHLEKTLGKGLPIAYALDGYPIYGYEEPDGSPVTALDVMNGHKDASGNYHYHASKTYPYLNGGFYGQVTEREGQVDPQPRAEPMRPAGRPLRGAKITGFQEVESNHYLLTYNIRGRSASIKYVIEADGTIQFTMTDPTGRTSSESYKPRPQEQRGEPGQRRPPPRPADMTRNQSPAVSAVNVPAVNVSANLTVTSSALDATGNLSAEFTCDGASASPPIQWSGAPANTKCFAINVWHIPGPGDVKSYWLLYNIPASVTEIPKNSRGIGIVGVNDKRRIEYDPMCSKGPGLKQYHITVYALSEELTLTPPQANRENLLSAIKDITLAEGTLDFQYERKR